MPFIAAHDGAQLFFKDWGRGRPVVLVHGWPLDADVWEFQQRTLKLVFAPSPTTAAVSAALTRPGTATITTPSPTT